MAISPMMPFWTDAYLGDTRHLSTLEHGAYILLLITAWRSKEGLLPDDDKMLSKFSGLPLEKWKKIRPVLEVFFTVENGFWAQGRLLDERKADFDFRKSQSQKAKARHLKNKETTHAGASAGHMPPPSPSPSPSQSKKVSKKDIYSDFLNQAVSAFNALGLSQVQKISSGRQAQLRARLKDCGGIEGWISCMEKIKASDFLMGRATAWRADFDFVLRENKFTKIMEGAYDNNKKNTQTENIKNQTQELIENGW